MEKRERSRPGVEKKPKNKSPPRAPSLQSEPAGCTANWADKLTAATAVSS